MSRHSPRATLGRWNRRFRTSISALMGRPRRKIFCVGLNKTGTTSLEATLRDMGYRLGRQRCGERLLDDWRRGRFERIVDLAHTADAFQDVPFSLPGTFKAMDGAFPGARFILTVRSSPERWLESIERFTKRRLGLGRPVTADDLRRDTYVHAGWSWVLWKSVFGVEDERPFDANRLVGAYRDHNASVQRHFRDRPRDLLVLDLSHEDAAAKLANFLGSPLSGGAIPRLNASSEAEDRDAA